MATGQVLSFDASNSAGPLPRIGGGKSVTWADEAALDALLDTYGVNGSAPSFAFGVAGSFYVRVYANAGYDTFVAVVETAAQNVLFQASGLAQLAELVGLLRQFADVVLSSAGASAVLPTASYTATPDAAIKQTASRYVLSHETVAIDLEFSEVQVGTFFAVSNESASGTAAHTVTLPAGVTWDGTNDVATLNAPDEAIVCFVVSPSRVAVLENIGSVAFS